MSSDCVTLGDPRLPGWKLGACRRWLARAAALLVVVALASACGGGGSAGQTAPETSSSPSQSAAPAVERLTSRDGERVTAALLGESTATETLMVGLRPEDAQLPPGSGLTLDLNRAIVDGNLARVPAVVTGPLAGSWTMLLTRIDGAWRVYGTVRS